MGHTPIRLPMGQTAMVITDLHVLTRYPINSSGPDDNGTQHQGKRAEGLSPGSGIS